MSKSVRLKNPKSAQSFDAINKAFDVIPEWRQKELAAKEKKEKKRETKRRELVNSCKNIDDNNDNAAGFTANTFDALFDTDPKKYSLTDTNTMNTLFDNNQISKSRFQTSKKRNPVQNLEDHKPKIVTKKVRRKIKKIKKKRKKIVKSFLSAGDGGDNAFDESGLDTLFGPSQKKPAQKRKFGAMSNPHLIKKRKLNKNESQKLDERLLRNKKKAESALIDKQKQILSQINTFDLKELMIDNIPSDYDEDKLKNYVAELCSVDCADINLFPHLTDDTKPNRAIFSFRTAVMCAIGCQHLLNATLGDNVLSVKPISNKYKAKHESADRNCKVIKMSNLHWKTSKKNIKRFFKATAGEPLKVNIHTTTGGYSTGEAKAEFIHYKCVNHALHKLNNTMLLGRSIKLMVGGSRQIMDTQNGIEFKGKTQQIAVFNISSDVQEKALKLFIQKELGNGSKVVDVHLFHHLDLFTTGYAFCKFASYGITNTAVEKLNGKLLSERPLRVIWSKPTKKYRLRPQLAGKTKVLLFTNLRYDVTESDISQFIEDRVAFEKHYINGIACNRSNFYVDGVEISENEKGFRFGMAKIHLNSAEYASLIVSQLNGKFFKRRKVTINYWDGEDDGDNEFDSNQNKNHDQNYKSTEKPKLNNECKDEDIAISTVHSMEDNVDDSKQNKAENSQIKAESTLIDKKQQNLSAINRFDLKELMIGNIPLDYDRDKLKNYVAELCSVDCAVLHLLGNTKVNKAILSFPTAVICAIGYKHLFNATLGGNVLSVDTSFSFFNRVHA